MSPRPRIEVKQTQRLALNASLTSSIEILRADAAGLTRFLEEQAMENPLLHVTPTPPALGDWLPRWTAFLTRSGGFAATPDGMAEIASPAPGLIAHVMAGVEGLSLPPRARRIALGLTEALEPSGWLGRPLAMIAGECSASVPEVEAVLARLQTLDPPGIFARTLAECLELQLRDAGQMDGVMKLLLANLPLLASGDTARLSRLCGADEAGILLRFRRIRALNPKPGADFISGRGATLREPDLLAEPGENGGWRVSLNRSALPSVEIRSGPGAKTGNRSQARALQNLVAARNATLLAVASEIASRQAAALHHGPAALLPLRMAEVAEALELHESTISRVVAGASLDTPRGTWWLRQMFGGAVGGSTGAEGAGQSAAAIRARLAELVRQEDPRRPLSDQAIAEALAQGGILIARRTAAKYREAEGIPPAPRRRRR